MSEKIKVCRKGLHEFSGDRCKECERSKNIAWREKNAAKIKDYSRKYYFDNKNEQNKKCAEYRIKFPEKIRQYSKQYYQKNMDREKFRCAEWRKNNQTKYREIVANYFIRNRSEIEAKWLQKRADLKDSYVLTLLGMKRGEAPQELIELKRVQLQITRKLRELEK